MKSLPETYAIFRKPDRPVDRVFIHCSGSDNPEHDSIHVIRQWHTQAPPKGNGWSDVGYHFFIKKDGEIQRGRPIEVIPAAQMGHNNGTIAICCHGLKIELFTEEERFSLIYLCEQINRAYNRNITFHGHNEVNPNKTCPVFPYREWLNLDLRGYIKPQNELKEMRPFAQDEKESLSFWKKVVLFFNKLKGKKHGRYSVKSS